MRIAPLFCLACIGCLVNAAAALGANEKIDPETYICAELVATNTDGEPPLYEALQMDGYAAAKTGAKTAEPRSLYDILLEMSAVCGERPTDKVFPLWQEARKADPFPEESEWQADKTTCAEFAANPEDHSGFIVWLDGYNRGSTGKPESVLSSQEAIDNFIKVCTESPKKLILDVIRQTAR